MTQVTLTPDSILAVAKASGHQLTADRHFFQYVVAFSATLCLFASGIAIGWNSPTIPILVADDSPIPLTRNEGSWLIQIAVLGLMISSYPAAWLCDHIGRKSTLLVGAIPLLTGWIVIAFADSVVALFVGRLCFGFSYGFTFTALPVYLCEIASDNIRGFLSAMPSAMVKSGFLFVFAMAPFVSIKTMAWTAAVPVCLFAGIFMWLPESPYYWLGRNNRTAAQQSLARLRGHSDVTEELDRMEVSVRKSEDNKGTFSELLSTDNRKGLLIALGMAAIIPLSGSSAITDYSQMIFEKIHSELTAVEASIVLAIVQLVSAIAGNCAVDIVGRKPLLLGSALSMGICTSIVAAYFYLERVRYDVTDIGWIPISMLMIFQVGFNVGLATVSYTLLGELFPKNLKSVVNALYMMVSSLLDVVVSKLFQTVSDGLGSDVSFVVFAVSSFLFVVFVVLVVPETKGKRLDVILVDMGADKYKVEEEKK